VTRLGPDSGGRAQGDPDVRVYSWEWGTGRLGHQERRPGLPWIGVFLLVFGGLLLIQQLYPAAQGIGSVLMLAIGLAFLIRWAISRGTGSLYAGAIITALAVPNALDDLGISRDGLGTLCLGVAFLFIALVRLVGGGGVGWQAWFGGLLTLVGAVNLIQPDIGGLIVPIALVGLGAALVFGSLLRPDRRGSGTP
jgi:drug/metabolite transporter (DMT)-like permease